METNQRLLRLPEVKARVGLGRTQIYEEIKEGRFPRQVALTARSVAWREADILAWIASRQEVKAPKNAA
jgi:prophage regulatory protein